MGHVLNQLKKGLRFFLSKNLNLTVSNRFRTQSNADVYLVHNIKIHTKTLTDGYFKFCIPLEQSNDYGWIDYEVSIIYKNETIITKSYIRPSIGNLGIISDIDDTFLVSYTLTHLKNYTIYYLETSTPESFEDVVHQL
jgi:phosphatidate phosphatase APP1